MDVKQRFLESIQPYLNSDKLTAYDPGHWKYFLINNGFLESNENDNWNEDAEEKGYHINPSFNEGVFNSMQSKCKFEIPEILKNAWLQSDGFIVTKGAKEERGLSSMPIRFGLLPMEAAFGGLDEIYKMREATGKDKLLQWPLLNPELFQDTLEYGFIKPGKVGLKGVFSNCIFIEEFSVDLLYYTLYKFDHEKKDKFAQMYVVLENGPYPLSLTLEEYFEAMFYFKGLVFCWPHMFILEDNVDQLVINEKYELIETAKKNSEILGLGVDFEKYGL